jgi:hypothetical protein
MATYRKKPVVIEAVRFIPQDMTSSDPFVRRRGSSPALRTQFEVYDYLHDTWVGLVEGDWIITGIQGETYPCKPDVFEATYEAV